MSLSNASAGPVTLLQAVIFLQFGTSFFITVMTTVGISFGYAVSSFFLMALLQTLVAIPGVVHVALEGTVWIAMYIAVQSVTAICEIYWLCVMIVDSKPVLRWIGLLVLTLINVSAIVIALWFRQKPLNLPGKKNKKAEKPNMKAPSTSMSDIERSKARSSKESPSTSPRKSSKNSFSEMSSKGSLKVRKPKSSSVSEKTIKSSKTTD